MHQQQQHNYHSHKELLNASLNSGGVVASNGHHTAIATITQQQPQQQPLAAQSHALATCARLKTYRVCNPSWHCSKCEVYCNSAQQFDVHLLSQKHHTGGQGQRMLAAIESGDMQRGGIGESTSGESNESLVLVKSQPKTQAELDQERMSRSKWALER